MKTRRKAKQRRDAPSLAQQLETASKETVKAVYDLDLKTALDSDICDVRIAAGMRIGDLAKDILASIKQDNRFPGERTLHIAYDSASSGCLYPMQVAERMIQRAIRSGSGEEAIDWMLKVLGTKEAAGKMIEALWGVPVDQEIALTKSVKIVPITDLPDGPQKRMLTEYKFGASDSVLMTSLDFVQPKSALVLERTVSPLVFDPTGNGNDQDEMKAYVADEALLGEITLALTVVGPRVPISAYIWFAYSDPDIQLAVSMNARRMRALEILPHRSEEYPPLDPTEAVEIVNAYLNLDDPTKGKVRLALQRLNQAQRRRSVGDRALELAIAFEALLGQGTTEMTHKITVRSTRLFGGDAEERKRNVALMKEMYQIRSTLVHEGKDATGTKKILNAKIPVDAIIDEAVLKCVELIKTIIRRGSIPEWSEWDVLEHSPE
ncbi:hypothetical protein BLA23254_07028 [Burkholderia lata]|uniref:Uncharacterized protein n=1 Tax=Burkholderia lata (strain ATCC 17760 / DSM 23089 / LMG 22485 / NCIMB 9086 / R18194 / 383) TaxID=482957 RepID=A0A6P2SA71_BURL3|nr:HEPN domain-containing protein [Burkholderia lata]VWC41814.1 hypothetical protein BLA23254_07028 [Burkholderia lata]